MCEENIFECKRDCSPSLTANSTGEIDCKFLTRYVYDQKNFIGNRDCSPSLTTNMTPNTGRIPFTRYVYSSFECKKDSSQVSTDFESVDALIENFHNYYDCVLKSKDPNLYKDKYDFICFLKSLFYDLVLTGPDIEKRYIKLESQTEIGFLSYLNRLTNDSREALTMEFVEEVIGVMQKTPDLMEDYILNLALEYSLSQDGM